MAKPRFTDEQIAEILQQSKEGRLIRSYVNTINLALARCGIWQEQHTEGIRSELKKQNPKRKSSFWFSLLSLFY